MFTFAIGITIIAIGVLFVVWSGVFNNRGTTNSIRDELEVQGRTNRDLKQSIDEAKSTVESISNGVREADSKIKQSIDGIRKTSEEISRGNKSDQEIFEAIRNQKLEK